MTIRGSLLRVAALADHPGAVDGGDEVAQQVADVPLRARGRVGEAVRRDGCRRGHAPRPARRGSGGGGRCSRSWTADCCRHTRHLLSCIACHSGRRARRPPALARPAAAPPRPDDSGASSPASWRSRRGPCCATSRRCRAPGIPVYAERGRRGRVRAPARVHHGPDRAHPRRGARAAHRAVAGHLGGAGPRAGVRRSRAEGRRGDARRGPALGDARRGPRARAAGRVAGRPGTGRCTSPRSAARSSPIRGCGCGTPRATSRRAGAPSTRWAWSRRAGGGTCWRPGTAWSAPTGSRGSRRSRSWTSRCAAEPEVDLEEAWQRRRAAFAADAARRRSATVRVPVTRRAELARGRARDRRRSGPTGRTSCGSRWRSATPATPSGCCGCWATTSRCWPRRRCGRRSRPARPPSPPSYA